MRCFFISFIITFVVVVVVVVGGHGDSDAGRQSVYCTAHISERHTAHTPTLNYSRLVQRHQQLMGFNIFTLVLGVLIIVLLGLNQTLGPGWLGQSLGMKGVGSFTEYPESLPATVDLSGPDFLL